LDARSSSQDFDLIVTSGFEEWSHSWYVETVVISKWSITRSDVNLKSSGEGEETVVEGFKTGIVVFWLPSVEWETVGEFHSTISLSISSFDIDVEMREGLNSLG